MKLYEVLEKMATILAGKMTYSDCRYWVEHWVSCGSPSVMIKALMASDYYEAVKCINEYQQYGVEYDIADNKALEALIKIRYDEFVLPIVEMCMDDIRNDFRCASIKLYDYSQYSLIFRIITNSGKTFRAMYDTDGLVENIELF